MKVMQNLTQVLASSGLKNAFGGAGGGAGLSTPSSLSLFGSGDLTGSIMKQFAPSDMGSFFAGSSDPSNPLQASFFGLQASMGLSFAGGLSPCETDDAPVSDAQEQGGAADPEAANNERYAALDASADPDDKAKWANLSGGDPQQATDLNRRMEVVSTLADKDATPEQHAAAQEYIDRNPAFKGALTNAGVLSDDGHTVDCGKAGDLRDDMRGSLKRASDEFDDYKKNNPDADKNARDATGMMCLERANMPISSNVTKDTAGQRVGYYHSEEINRDDVSQLGADQDTAATEKKADDVMSKKGIFDKVDRSGVDAATNGLDGLADAGNLDHYIGSEAPKTADDYGKFSADAALRDVTDTPTDGLNADVFDHPDKYSPQQLGAVMVKLIDTLVSVKAGGDSGDKLKDTSKTEKQLTDKINQLAKDPRVQQYLKTTMPPEMLALGQGIAGSQGHVFEGSTGNAANGTAAPGSTSGDDPLSQAHDDASHVKDGLDGAKDVTRLLSSLTNGTTAGAEAGAEGGAAAADAAATIGTEAGVETGAVAGAEAGAEGGILAGGLASAGETLGIGAVVAGIVAGIMELVKAVQKHDKQVKFGENVDPTCKQFGIDPPK